MTREELIAKVSYCSDFDEDEVNEDTLKQMDSLDLLDLEIEIEKESPYVLFKEHSTLKGKTLTEALGIINNLINRNENDRNNAD